MHVRDDSAWLAELLMDLEDDVGEIAQLRLVDELRSVLDVLLLPDAHLAATFDKLGRE